MSYYYLLLPAVIISLYAQIKVQSTYSKYSKVQALSLIHISALH